VDEDTGNEGNYKIKGEKCKRALRNKWRKRTEEAGI
jgi:hypothetical protein